MRKKITIFLMMLIASFMLITSTNEVYAFEYEPEMAYGELFSMNVEIEFETQKAMPSGFYEEFESFYQTFLETNHEVDEMIYIDQVRVNNVLAQHDNYDFYIRIAEDGYFRFSYSNKNSDDITDFFMLTSWNGLTVYDDFLFSNENDTIKLSNKVTYQWDKTSDYGRVRNDGDYDWDLGLLTVNNQERVYILNDIGGITIVNHDADGAALFQSPYRNFRIVKEIPGSSDVIELDIEDVAAVYVSGGADDNVFYIYYWDNDEIAKTTYTMPNFTPPSSGLRNAYFYGGIREAISGEETMVANVDNLVPLTDFLQYIEAWDDLDGDISDQVVIVDDGNYKNDVVGVYTVTFGVTDSENNISYLEVDIHVVDIVAPTITGTTSDIQISYTDEFSVSSWVNSLQVTDNYYTSNLDITVKTNTYSANKTTPGNYYVEVKVTDGSGNVGTLIRNITVVDDKGPEFQGLNTITTSISENLTINDIKSGLAAIDAIDGNVTNSITVDSDQLTGNNTQPGTYEVIFKAVDSQGNASFHTVTVTIVSQPPKFYIIDGSSIRLLPGANLTIEQILALLGVTDPINLTSNYNAEVPGTYQLSFTVGNEDYNLNIIVLGANQPGIPPALVGDNNFKIDWKIVGWVVLGLVAVVGVAYILKKKK